MNRAHRRLLLPVLAAGCACILQAAEPAAAAPPPPAPAAPAPAAATAAAAAPGTVGPVVTLPVLQVRESRMKELDKLIAKLDKQIAREKKKVKSSDLDRALNNTKLANAAAIFGGNSADHLSAVAATRVSLMEAERDVLESMKLPRSKEDLALLEAELDQIRINRRNLDDVQLQR